MTEREILFLRETMLGAEYYLEFGSGHSTTLATSIPSLRQIVSVESDRQFVVDQLMINSDILRAIADRRLTFCYVNIGATGTWGHPKNKTERHMWPNYALGQLQYCPWSLVLVDGRFRIACCLAAALELPKEAVILLHDFYRPEYHYVLRYMEVVRRVDTLVQLRLRTDVSRKLVQAAIAKYQYIPGDCTKLRVVWRRAKEIFGMSQYPGAPLRKTAQASDG